MQALNERVQTLEQALAERPADGGGFLGGLFGGGAGAFVPTDRLAARRTPAMAAGAQYAAPAAPGRGWSSQAQPMADDGGDFDTFGDF